MSHKSSMNIAKVKSPVKIKAQLGVPYWSAFTEIPGATYDRRWPDKCHVWQPSPLCRKFLSGHTLISTRSCHRSLDLEELSFPQTICFGAKIPILQVTNAVRESDGFRSG